MNLPDEYMGAACKCQPNSLNSKLETQDSKHFYRRPLIIRSMDACPPPPIKSASALPSKATGSSVPVGAKKAGQSSLIAVNIVHTIRKAPTRVSNPRRISTPPSSSLTAAAPNHSEV